MDLLLKINCTDEQIPFLISVFDDKPVSLLKRQDGLYLQSSEIIEEDFDQNNSVQISATWIQARWFIARINGAAKYERADWAPLSLINMKVTPQNGEEQWYPITAIVNIRNDVKTLSARELLTIADESAHVAKALRLQCREMDWINLYRLLEVVRQDVGGDDQIVKNDWAKKNNIEAFTGSANNTKVIGDESRHGKIDESGQPPSRTMRLHEAKPFIQEIVLHWLKAKISSI